MAAKAVTTAGLTGDNMADLQEEPAEGIILEADYEEDRPISLLAERQREFQKAMQRYFVDTEMPAA